MPMQWSTGNIFFENWRIFSKISPKKFRSRLCRQRDFFLEAQKTEWVVATAADEFIMSYYAAWRYIRHLYLYSLEPKILRKKWQIHHVFFQLLIISRHLLCFAIGDAELRTLDKESFTDSSFRNAVFYTVRIYKYVGCYGFFSRVQINSKVGRPSKCLDTPSQNM